MMPCRRPEIAWRIIDEEAIVVNPHTGLIFPLNPVATRFWELADGQHAFDAIIRDLSGEFDAPLEQIERDMQQFMGDLQRNGLITAKKEPVLFLDEITPQK